MERFFIYAKPNIKTGAPYKLNLYPETNVLSSTNNLNINLRGEYFFNIRNVYISGSDPGMFDNGVFFNPFSAIPNLYPSNPGFFAVVIPEFTLFNDKAITFTLPQTPKTNGFFDVIVENESGYGKLTTGSFRNYVSSWSGFTAQQFPTVSGVQIEIIV